MSIIEEPIPDESEHPPLVASPYANTTLSPAQHLAISSFWFATNFLWGALLVIMLPHEIKALVPQFRAQALGLFTGAASVVALIIPLLTGALSDRCTSRFGRRRPFIAVGVIINLAGIGMMWAAYEAALASSHPELHASAGFFRTVFTTPGILLFFLAYLVVQFGNNVASAAYSGVIPDLVPENQRGRASGYMALMSQLGTLLGGLLTGMVLGNQPEFVKFGVLGLVLGGVTLITLFGIRENPLSHRPPKLEWGKYLRSLWIDPHKYPDFAWVWITRALVMLGFYSVMPFVNYYLTDVIGIEKPETAASALLGALLLASAISGIAGGYISDRVGRKRVVYVANMIIAVMVLAFIFCRNLEQVLAAGLCFGLGFGAYTSVDWALGTDVLPTKHNAAKEMAVWHIAMTLPQALAAPFAGFLIGLWGMTTVQGPEGPIYHYPLAGYSAVFIFTAVCFAVGAYLLRNVRSVR